MISPICSILLDKVLYLNEQNFEIPNNSHLFVKRNENTKTANFSLNPAQQITKFA